MNRFNGQLVLMVGAIAVLSFCGQGIADIVELSPTADAVVNQFLPDGNFDGGNNESAAVRLGKHEDGTLSRGYYMVDLSSLVGKQITAASFEIYHAGKTLFTRSIHSNWTEQSITWNSQPTSGFSSWEAGIAIWRADSWARRQIVLGANAIAEMQDAIDNGDGKFSLVVYCEKFTSDDSNLNYLATGSDDYIYTEPYPWSHADTWLKENSETFYRPVFKVEAVPEPATSMLVMASALAVLTKRGR